jgi:predicted ATPase
VLLLDLLRPPDPPVLLLICAYRNEDLDTSPCLSFFLMRLNGRNGSHQRLVTVESLSPADSRRLALKTLDRVDSTAAVLADRISQEAAGDPLFVQELVRHVQEQISRVPSRAIALPVTTLSLESVLWQRIRRLPEPAYKLLEIIAIAAGHHQTACQAAELGSESWGTLTLLRSERLIRGTGMALSEKLETYHDRIRETVVANLAPQVLKNCHCRLAKALEFDAANDPEELAVHYEAAGETIRAGELYAKAAVDAASALAFDRAAKLYESALRLLPETDRRRRGFRLGLAESLANAGRGEDAAREYLAVAQISNPAEGLELNA